MKSLIYYSWCFSQCVDRAPAFFRMGAVECSTSEHPEVLEVKAVRYVCFRADANEYWKLLCNSVLQEGSLRNGFLPTSVPFGVGRRHWCHWSPSSSASPSYPIAQPCAWLSCGRETNGSLWVSHPQGHLVRTLSCVETKKDGKVTALRLGPVRQLVIACLLGWRS